MAVSLPSGLYASRSRETTTEEGAGSLNSLKFPLLVPLSHCPFIYRFIKSLWHEMQFNTLFSCTFTVRGISRHLWGLKLQSRILGKSQSLKSLFKAFRRGLLCSSCVLGWGFLSTGVQSVCVCVCFEIIDVGYVWRFTPCCVNVVRLCRKWKYLSSSRRIISSRQFSFFESC